MHPPSSVTRGTSPAGSCPTIKGCVPPCFPCIRLRHKGGWLQGSKDLNADPVPHRMLQVPAGLACLGSRSVLG